MAQQDSSNTAIGKRAIDDFHHRSQEQARDILAQWRNHTLSTRNNPEAELEDTSTMAEVFKVLSDPARLSVIQVLVRAGEMCVRDLADDAEMNQSSVSHHLRILRHFRLVRARRQGRRVLYGLDDPHVEMLLRVCLDHLRDG
jgi:DNA-binding transcriptional ArsR family regulator